MTSLKTCFKCKAVKPISDFYKHPQMSDGHLGKCKECAKKDASEHRTENIDRIREYDRKRANIPERRKAAQKISALWRKEDARRSASHNAVARAVVLGVLVRQPCERCGGKKSVAHHESYDRKLDVNWLCQPCHKTRHKEMATEGIEP